MYKYDENGNMQPVEQFSENKEGFMFFRASSDSAGQPKSNSKLLIFLVILIFLAVAGGLYYFMRPKTGAAEMGSKKIYGFKFI